MKNNIKWALFFIFITGLFLFPTTHDVLMRLTGTHPYIMGFAKFSILAFLGELLGMRISNGEWRKPKGVYLRVLAWGLMGIAITFVLPLCYSTIFVFKQQGIIVYSENSALFNWVQAITASIIFNLLPGPMVIIYHKLAETYIELCEGKIFKLRQIRFSTVITSIDWVNLIQFVLLRVNLILFIPMNTIVFLLPPNLRVLLAAYSSILLGAVLGYFRSKSNKLITKIKNQ